MVVRPGPALAAPCLVLSVAPRPGCCAASGGQARPGLASAQIASGAQAWENLGRRRRGKESCPTLRGHQFTARVADGDAVVAHLQVAQVILGNIETNIPQYAIEY